MPADLIGSVDRGVDLVVELDVMQGKERRNGLEVNSASLPVVRGHPHGPIGIATTTSAALIGSAATLVVEHVLHVFPRSSVAAPCQRFETDFYWLEMDPRKRIGKLG
ncbi:hypothetical protein [Nocardioides sp. R-C-SC26]|uniref:hypothetical protein n=1 Tax=Nocardioides sp. R-C-SC26 TaxID=2870414 RepID=UPI001E58C63C|nr:hypothetical protein [Nocardioides sp. R-C-SC26]